MTDGDGLRPDFWHGRIGEIDLFHLLGAGDHLYLDDAVVAVSLHGCREGRLHRSPPRKPAFS